MPLDSWIYPALEGLAALGYVNSAIVGMRPWTRMECARQVSEASDRIVDESAQDGRPDEGVRTTTICSTSSAAKWICSGEGTSRTPPRIHLYAKHSDRGQTVDRRLSLWADNHK